MRSFAVAHGRSSKAEKIEAVLCDALNIDRFGGRSILDIGAGSGHIAAHFAASNKVTAADVEDQLCVPNSGLQFLRLAGNTIPSENNQFDVVLLNHVLPYVPDQIAMLREVARVLKPDGCCYVASPNRLFPLDPHSHMPFVHYLPQSWYEWVVNHLRHANEHILLRTTGGMRQLFIDAGLDWTDYTVDVMHEPNRYHAHAPFHAPRWRWLSWLSPTNIFVIRKRSYG